MTFLDWLFSRNPEGVEVYTVPWGLGEILTLICCFAIIILVSIFFRKKDEKTKRKIMWIFVGLIIFFELARRTINLIGIPTQDRTLEAYLYHLLPRPWCAISCWSLIFAMIIDKKFAYNFSAITSLLCAIIFFAYPSVGFTEPIFDFESLYSVATHSLLLMTSILFMTLGFVDFDYKKIWQVALYMAFVLAYAFFEIYVLKIADDPLYFMPNNDVQKMLGLSYPAYLVSYIAFLIFYFNVFYLVNLIKKKKQNKKLEKTTI